MKKSFVNIALGAICLLLISFLPQDKPKRKLPLIIGKDITTYHGPVSFRITCDKSVLKEKWERILRDNNIEADLIEFRIMFPWFSELKYSVTLNGIDTVRNITAAIPIMTKYRLIFEEPINGGGKMVICKSCKDRTYGFFDDDNKGGCSGNSDNKSCVISEIVSPELFFWE